METKLFLVFGVLLLFSMTFISAYDESAYYVCGGDDQTKILCSGDNDLDAVPEKVSGRLFEEGKPTLLCILLCIFFLLLILCILFLLYKKKKNEKH